MIDMATKTVHEIAEYPMTKKEAFSSVKGSFDCALPQHWLDGVTQFAIDSGRLDVSYDLILSTTVWLYENGHGQPLTCCTEVAEVIEQYHNS